LAAVTAEWTRKWKEFCQWIVDEYGLPLQDYEPTGHR
jgi:adenosine deaminase CECR1